MKIIKILKMTGLFFGTSLVFMSVLGKTTEVQWAVGMFLVWGFIYLLED